MSDTPETAVGVEAAMEKIRRDVDRQLGVERIEAVDVDLAQVERFSSDLPKQLEPDERERLLAQAEQLQPWLQGPFLLGGDLVIGGAWRNDLRWAGLAEHVPDITGKRVLDIGSNAGYDPFVFKLRGAAEVIACEPFQFIHQARFLESIYRSGVDFRETAWEQLDPAEIGKFDLIHCHGVLYHEVHPMLLLERLRSLLADDGTLLFGSMMLGDPSVSEYARFVPNAYFGDPTWWWVPGRLAMRWMLESSGLMVEEEFGLADGPQGEFQTVNGYFRTTRGEPIVPPVHERYGFPSRPAPAGD